jgi:23S rRNA G2445 N2-methylase RlmL
VNPPYGHRLGDARGVTGLFQQLGRVLRERFAGWRVGVVTADARHAAALGLRTTTQHRLRNGGLQVFLLRCEIPSPPS